MHIQKSISLIKIKGSMYIGYVRSFSISVPKYLNQRWREERGLPMNPNAYGVLTDKPDYSFLDGKLTPYGTRQVKRFVKQREITEQIMTLSKEIDFAVARHENMKTEEQKSRQSILDSKLKPKGLKLYEK